MNAKYRWFACAVRASRGAPGLRLAFAAIALLGFPAAQAAVRCVGSVNGADGLLPAFADANNGDEGGTWDIRVRAGVYQL